MITIINLRTVDGELVQPLRLRFEYDVHNDRALITKADVKRHRREAARLSHARRKMRA